MASPTQCTWIWIDSGSWWWTGRPGVLQFMGSQRVGHDWVTILNWTEPCSYWPLFKGHKHSCWEYLLLVSHCSFPSWEFSWLQVIASTKARPRPLGPLQPVTGWCREVMPWPPCHILEPSRRAIPAQSFLCLRPCLQPHCDHLLPLSNPVLLQLLSLRVLPAKPSLSQSPLSGNPNQDSLGQEWSYKAEKGIWRGTICQPGISEPDG